MSERFLFWSMKNNAKWKKMCYNTNKRYVLGEFAMSDKMSKEARFEEIYRMYQNDVYKISLYYVKDAHTAQDISQKVFYQFYLHFENVDVQKIKPYLIRAARNLSYNWNRDHAHEVNGEHVDVVGDKETLTQSVEADFVEGERKKETEVFVGNIMESLRRENETWYEVMNLIFCMEKSHDEVARELGITKDVLYSKLYRAKKWILKHYKEEYEKL